MKYLAVVESALNPTAGSRAGAKGLWQFMYYTGKLCGCPEPVDFPVLLLIKGVDKIGGTAQ